MEAQIIIHVNIPATEATGLALINLFRTALESKITQAELDKLNTALSGNTDELSEALKTAPSAD